jgi:hypothetical protein
METQTMKPLTRENLFSLEQYSEKRPAFRAQVIEHKKHRRVDIGENLSLYFEDRLTIQYQVQEMLRIERIFEADARPCWSSRTSPCARSAWRNWSASSISSGCR